MIEEIHIQKNGFYISEYNENLKERELIQLDEPFWCYYNHELILGDGVTFGDVFTNLEPYLEKLDEHFLADTRGWEMKGWFEEIKKPKTKQEIQFFEIRFHWIVETDKYFNRRTNEYDNSFNKYLTFSVMAKSEEEENEVDRYAISFMDIQNLRDLPIAFEKHCEIDLFDPETENTDILFEFKENITLREFIICLFSEITFYGNPEQTKKEFEELDDKIREDDQLDDDDETKYTSLSELQLKLLEIELNVALSREDYKWAENVKIEMERIKKENQ